MHFNIAHLACDCNSRRILSALDGGPRSVKEIAQLSGVSLARCYRLVKELERLNIIHQSRGEGREMFYSSNLRSLEMTLEGERVSLSIEFRDGTVSELAVGPDDLIKESSAPHDRLVGGSTAGSTAA